MKIKQFGISFGDNDFYQTFSELLPLIVKGFYNNWRIKEKSKEKLKEIIVRIVNRSASGVYWAYQNTMSYNTDWDARNYLKITKEDVFIDDELTKYILDHDNWDNSELFCITVDEDNPIFWSV